MWSGGIYRAHKSISRVVNQHQPNERFSYSLQPSPPRLPHPLHMRPMKPPLGSRSPLLLGEALTMAGRDSRKVRICSITTACQSCPGSLSLSPHPAGIAPLVVTLQPAGWRLSHQASNLSGAPSALQEQGSSSPTSSQAVVPARRGHNPLTLLSSVDRRPALMVQPGCSGAQGAGRLHPAPRSR